MTSMNAAKIARRCTTRGRVTFVTVRKDDSSDAARADRYRSTGGEVDLL